MSEFEVQHEERECKAIKFNIYNQPWLCSSEMKYTDETATDEDRCISYPAVLKTYNEMRKQPKRKFQEDPKQINSLYTWLSTSIMDPFVLNLNTTKATAYRLRFATFSKNEVKEIR